ncbi:hypothetical protein [Dactylosporangium roseum]|uniref:hypothetical protein n=1 Tax=Dactylosporangium roseum TaxID=47989 RepID=UPI0021B17ED0|nr:hypothetical protein [Dactylosporangium roseum]
MKKKVALGVAAVFAALSLALGVGLAVYHSSSSGTPAAESRPPKDGEVPAPPPPRQLKPSERVVVTSK